jgi:hypothetical protein
MELINSRKPTELLADKLRYSEDKQFFGYNFSQRLTREVNMCIAVLEHEACG